jgi:hypothetical protein
MRCIQCKGRCRSPHLGCNRCDEGPWCISCFNERSALYHGLCNDCIEQDNEEADRLDESEQGPTLDDILERHDT